MLVKGRFERLIEVASENRTAVFNILDIPLGHSLGVDVPPGFLQLASEEFAATTAGLMVQETDDLRDDLVWGTAANTYAASWVHVDDEGFGTSTCTLAGGKLWAIATPLNPERQVESIHAFSNTHPEDFKDEDFRFELIHLPPRCVL